MELRAHEPTEPTEKPEELPFDWTTLSDLQLFQRQYGTHNALAYWVTHKMMVEEAIARRCRQAQHELKMELMIAVDTYDSHDKQRTMTLIEAEIENDPTYKSWRRRKDRHEHSANVHRQERDALNKLVEGLSRLETMRDNEFQRSGGKRGR